MSEEVKVRTRLPRKKAEALRDKGIRSAIRRSHDHNIQIMNPSDFFAEFSKPVESRLYSWMEEAKRSTEEMLDQHSVSRLVEVNAEGRWRWRVIRSSQELKECLNNSSQAYEKYLKLQERAMGNMLRGREDMFGGYGFADDTISTGGAQGGLPYRTEFTPLIGSPFFKQMYLADYWKMHSKLFWYKNYSAIAKMVVDMTRNFVMGKGFNVQFEDQKAQDVWNRYEDLSEIQEHSRQWCDDLTWAGENMIKKIPGPAGIMHKAIDASTIWEIVTDPEDINDIKYYHQQYNTQYQLYGTKDAPISKYIINQIPPELLIHTKVNVTPYEKRGRSDLLGVLLYFKYYEDYISAKLARAKNEASFIWDVEIDGSDEDVQAYIMSTENIADVPPGSENVHNKAVKRTPLSPTFGKAGADAVINDILSYVAMGVGIPVNYMGTFGTGGYTKAGALVATEPVAKKMVERQQKMEFLIRRIVKDVLVYNKMDPKKYTFEITFPEIMEEDRTTKIQDLYLARDNGTFANSTVSYMVAKELKVTKYDYESEQEKIKKERKSSDLFPPPAAPTEDPERQFDRAQVKKDGLDL